MSARLLPGPEPHHVCARMAGPHRVLLDSCGAAQGRWSFLAAAPVARLVVRGEQSWLARGEGALEPVGGDPLELARELLAELAAPPASADAPPFVRGLLGALGYGLRGRFEPLPRAGEADPLPDLWLGCYPRSLAHDHERGGWIASGDWSEHELSELLAPAPPQAPAALPRLRWRERPDRAGHRAAVERTRELIRDGDLYQLNMTCRFEASHPGLHQLALPLHARLRTSNPAPFAAYLELEQGERLVSCSPERFVELRGDRLRTRPIKGTLPRGETPEADRAAAEALLASAKDRAELAMIVDVLRNDLGKVAATGSVQVSEPLRLESYASVHHLVATIEARLAPGRDWVDLLRAAFPGGSITGAPRVRAMERIAELEPVERGIYTGSIGYIDARGDLDLSIAIRTLAIAGDRVSCAAGGGITLASDPDLEHRELLAKAAPLLEALGAIEP